MTSSPRCLTGQCSGRPSAAADCLGVRRTNRASCVVRTVGWLLLATFGCATPADTPSAPSANDDALIYSALAEFQMGNWVLWQNAPAEYCVVEARPLEYPAVVAADTPAYSSLAHDLRELELSTLTEFVTAQAQVQQLHSGLFAVSSSAPRVRLLSPEHSLALGQQRWWQAFEHAFPQAAGLMRVSGIGYSVDRRQALVYVELLRSENVQVAYYVLLHQHAGNWSIARVSQRWA